MKLNLIKLASVLMVLSMVFALAVPAFAEEPVATYNVTFHYGDGTTSAHVANEGEVLATPEAPADELADGRTFQGWYCHGVKVEPGVTVVTEDMDIYAKYVATVTVGDKVLNKKMLDVKYQAKPGAYEDTADVRFVSSIDSLDYKSVTFKVTLGDSTYSLKTNNAYTALSGEDKTPAQAFVADSQYFVAYSITNIPINLYAEVDVQVVLELKDGTTVAGNVCTLEIAA